MAKVVSDTHAAAALSPATPYADFVEFARDRIETTLSPNVALGAGLEAFGQEVARYAHTAFKTAGETARGLLDARTFEDVVQLQTDFANRSFEDFVARSTKLAELGCSFFGASLGAWGARAKI